MKYDEDQSLFPRHPAEVPKKDALLESLPESKRWDPVPGSVGHQVPESPDEDEDAEGRSEAEQLVDDGSAQASQEHADASRRAAKHNTLQP